jgi:hypothetical protein
MASGGIGSIDALEGLLDVAKHVGGGTRPAQQSYNEALQSSATRTAIFPIELSSSRKTP